MQKKSIKIVFVLAVLCGFLTCVTQAAPLSRVARLSAVDGLVSFAPADDNRWAPAVLNRPLSTSDQLWTAAGARAELQLNSGTVRLSSSTSLRLLNLNDRINQFELTQGTLSVVVWKLKYNQTYEIDTPNLAFIIQAPGIYRLDVNPQSNMTLVSLQRGRGTVYGENAAYTLMGGQSYLFGANLRNYQVMRYRHLDQFDRWGLDRDRLFTQARSARYVSRDVIGYQDLDLYGTWHYVRPYGYVWMPKRVPGDWAPYRSGHWEYMNEWGWTWVDSAPWGFAPFHYGRWVQLNGRWNWVPGPARLDPVYAPALVAFIGGEAPNQETEQNDIAWFPLGPEDVYTPTYTTDQTYFTNVNRSNMQMNPLYLRHFYGRHPRQFHYRNREAQNAITMMPAEDFRNSRKGSHPTDSRWFREKAPITQNATIAPNPYSTGGKTYAPTRGPAERIENRSVIAKTPPPQSGRNRQSHTSGHLFDKTAHRVMSADHTAPQNIKVITPVQPVTPRSVPVNPVTESAKPGQQIDGAAAAKIEAEKTAAAKAETERATAAKAEAEKAEAKRATAAKVEAEKAEAERAAAAKAEAEKAEAERAAVAKVEAEKAEAERAAAAKAEATKTEEERAAAAKAEATKTEEERTAAAKVEAEKAEAERAAATKVEAEKAEAERAAAAQAEAEKAQAERAAAQAEAAKAEAERAAAAKVEAEKAEAERAAAVQAEAAKAEAERVAAAQAEAEKAQAERAAAQAEAAKAEAERAAAVQAEAAKAEAERAAAAKAEAEKAEAERAAAAKAEAEKAEAERAAAAQAEAAKAEAERAATAKAEAAKAEAERAAAAQAEAAKEEAERAAAQAEAAKIEAEKAAAAKAEAEKAAAQTSPSNP